MTVLPRAFATLLSIVCSNSYKNKENIDLTSVDSYKRHVTDTGSPEYQAARLTARIVQIAKHLKTNRDDFHSRRGLQLILAKRKSLLQYLYRVDR